VHARPRVGGRQPSAAKVENRRHRVEGAVRGQSKHDEIDALNPIPDGDRRVPVEGKVRIRLAGKKLTERVRHP
jgi:hypothetical protein